MINRFIDWLDRQLKGPPPESPEQLYDLLRDRSSTEIAARLLNRAEILDRSPRRFLRRCAVLDRVAAEHIERLVMQANPGQDITPWREARDRMRAQLNGDGQ